MTVDELPNVRGARRFANGVGDIDREEIRAGNESVYRLEPDMIGVYVPLLSPIKGDDCGLGSVEDTLRFRANEGVFPVGLVPYGNDLDSLLSEHVERPQLGARLLPEPVSDPK